MTTLAEYLKPTMSDMGANVGTTPMPGIRIYLGTAIADDPILIAWYSTAIDWCNQKLSERDFVDSAGVDEQPPDACVLGVYEFVRVLRDHSERANVLARRIKTGAREEEYFEQGIAGRITQAGIAAWPYLEPYVEDPTLFASGGV